MSTVPLPTHHTRGVMLMLLSAALFAVNVLLVRALGEAGPANVWLVSSTRFVVGLVMLAAFYRREWQPARLWRSRKLAERGLIGGFATYLSYLAVVKIGAGRATFINNTYVVWGALLAAWLLRERLRPAAVGGAIVALTGLALLTEVVTAFSHPDVYDAVAVLAAGMAGYVVVTIRQLLATETSATIFSAQCAFGLLLCAPPAFLHLDAVTPLAWVLMLLAGVFAAGGQLTMTSAFRDLTVAEGSLLQMLVPLGVAAGGAAFFHERFAPHELVGAGLILAGCVFTALRR